MPCLVAPHLTSPGTKYTNCNLRSFKGSSEYIVFLVCSLTKELSVTFKSKETCDHLASQRKYSNLLASKMFLNKESLRQPD